MIYIGIALYCFGLSAFMGSIALWKLGHDYTMLAIISFLLCTLANFFIRGSKGKR